MMYCTKCGSDLKGNRVRCPVCGYEVIKMKKDLAKPKERAPQRKEGTRPWAPPIPDQRSEDAILEEEEEVEEPPEPEEAEKEEDPLLVSGCSICGARPVHRCFFTMAPLCERHTVYMQIYVRNMPFGDRVPASPDIAAEKDGRVPTQDEAKEAGMFFTIKPYHEWKRVGRK